MLMVLCWLAGCGVSAVLGVVFAQQVKDWLKGIPAHVRAEAVKLETEILARFKKTGV